MSETTLTDDLAEHGTNMLARAETHTKQAAAIRAEPKTGWDEADLANEQKARVEDKQAKRHTLYARYASEQPVSKYASHSDQDGMTRDWEHHDLHSKAAAAQRTVRLNADDQPE